VTAERAARMMAAGRVAIGTVLCVSPGLAAMWAGGSARTPGAHVITRSAGARDAALGLGTLIAKNETGELRHWLLASSACDAADFAATLAGPRSPGRTAVLGFAAGGTLACLWLASLTRPRPGSRTSRRARDRA
jgi:hypothetical protein